MLSNDTHPYAAYMRRINELNIEDGTLHTRPLSLKLINDSSTTESAANASLSCTESKHKFSKRRPPSSGFRRLINLDSTKDLYPYPFNTPGSDNAEGLYLHRFTKATEAAVLLTINKTIEDKLEFIHLCSYSLHPTLTVLRYLRANDFDPTKSVEHMKRNIEWRKTNNVNRLTDQNPEDILGCKLEELTAVFPHWQIGHDKTGRSFLYIL